MSFTLRRVADFEDFADLAEDEEDDFAEDFAGAAAASDPVKKTRPATMIRAYRRMGG
ncbi:MAG: hypothetical protein H7138_04420 [Myxococcales bacterium]|nr:hypothetical protein [Myxococcales bacterium]